ncbi:MAG TPA: sigma-70 family RNA polymerase sigma factor [Thermomicrobiales bacterium]|nr:sigma-70 family RNA polymerase sigma factor [Thermomicrobiales bacterium]
MADDRLLERARSGDLEALEELCEREWRPVYGIVYAAVRNVGEAQDLTQEVFFRALRSLPRYRDMGVPFSAYLGTIARNLVRNRWRQRQPHVVSLDEAVEVPSDLEGPEQRALDRVDAERVRQALRELSDDHYTVIRLRIFEGKSAAEAGQVMGRSPDAIRQLQHRAILAMRASLREESRSR